MDRFKKFGRSFRHAARGFQYVLTHEKNFQNELFIALFVVIGMFLFHVTRSEAIVLTFVIMIVLITELLNTVVERMVDILKPRVHPYAKLIKGLMAA
ncbi:MAG: diacylglycerol kinase family protein, partial [Ignavibacteriaceae bacterium]